MLNSPQAITALTPRVLKRPELLAPAGDWECARAAVENGADAICLNSWPFCIPVG